MNRSIKVFIPGSMNRLLVIAIIALLTICESSMAHDQNPWIQFEGQDAHPTKILAKLSVDFQNEQTAEELESLLGQLDLEVVRAYGKGLGGLVLIDQKPNQDQALNKKQQTKRLKEHLAALESSGLFVYVQPNFIRYPILDAADPAYVDGRQWGLDNDGKAGGKSEVDIDVDLAWDLTIGSRSVVVAVIDSGIRYTHQDLAGNMWSNPGEVPDDGIDNDLNGIVDDIHGFNAILQNGDPLDVIDHGTNVASVIGATSDDKDVVGVAQEVSLMACKALTEFGGEDADLVSSIEYAVLMGADIINASWGNYSYSQAIFDAISMAQAEGILFVAGAGNDATNNDVTPFYPASHDLDNVISVASFDKFDLLSDHSNYGLISVDIAAPGSEIYMAGSGDEAGAMGANVLPDEDYDYADGTSFAAPHVTGVAVLLKSIYPDLLATELKEMILSSAIKTPALTGKVATEGRLNAFNALQVQPDGLLEVTVTPPSGSVMLTGEIQTIEVRVTDIAAVSDAEVVGVLPQGGTLQFLNDGQAPDAAADDATYTASVTLSGIGEATMQIDISHPNYTMDRPLSIELNYTLVERPKNDDFSQAQKIEPEGAEIITYSKFAAMEEFEPMHADVMRADDSLWWKYYPESDVDVLVDSAGSDYDTIISVYQGDSLESLTEIASVDDVISQNGDIRKAAYLNFQAIAGECYYIAVSAYGEDRGGSLRLNVEPLGMADWLPPKVSILEPKTGLTTTESVIELAGFAFDPDPHATGVREIVIRINGEMVGGGATGLPDWNAEVFLMPGANRIEVSAIDWSGNRSGVERIDVRYITYFPDNDFLVRAIKLEGNQGQILKIDNSEATKEMQEPYHAGNMGGRSLWYEFSPESDGKLILMTRRTQVDTLLALYESKQPLTRRLEEVTSNDDISARSGISRIDHAVEGGHIYYIALDGFCGDSGTIDLSYVFEPMDVFQVHLELHGQGDVVGLKSLYYSGESLNLEAKAAHDHAFDAWNISGSSALSEDERISPTLSKEVTGETVLLAQFKADPATEDFEDMPLSIMPDGSSNWSLSSGGYLSNNSLASPATADDSSSSFGFISKVQNGVGSFYVKTSTEKNWDKLVFKCDGQVLGSWSGETDWQSFEFSLKEGFHHFEWVYSKDSFGAEGLDTVFVDDINLPLYQPKAFAGNKTASVYVKPSLDGTLDIEVQGVAGESYVIEASKGLQTWEVIHRGLADSEGRMQLRGVSGGGKAQSFYRAVTE